MYLFALVLCTHDNIYIQELFYFPILIQPVELWSLMSIAIVSVLKLKTYAEFFFCEFWIEKQESLKIYIRKERKYQVIVCWLIAKKLYKNSTKKYVKKGRRVKDDKA